MRSERALLALLDIRDNVRLACDVPGASPFDDFKADRRTFYAVSRCLEIVSEAARRLPGAVRERNPSLPWCAIMGLGNVYRHEYDNLVGGIVWRAVNNSLQPLADAMESEIFLAEAENRTDG